MPSSEKTAEEIADAAKQNAALYLTQIPSELEPARRLLMQYTDISYEDVDAHIIEIRDKAWAVFPYGGIGSFKFLDMNETLQDPSFQTIINRLKVPNSTETLLDVGCCLGNVIRQLIVEGVPSERLYGTDLQPRFLDFGYDLFRDREVTQATYISGDVLREDDTSLDVLKHGIDIVYASAFFHLFEREDQMKAIKRIIGFLKPDNQNAMIFGRNGGPKVAGWENYVLREETFKQMWDEVGKETGTSWRVEVFVKERDDSVQTRFTVQRK